MSHLSSEAKGRSLTNGHRPSPCECGIAVDTARSEIEITRYVKSDGWVSRYWAVYVGGDLLAVVLYKKGAQAIADKLLSIPV